MRKVLISSLTQTMEGLEAVAGWDTETRRIETVESPLESKYSLKTPHLTFTTKASALIHGKKQKDEDKKIKTGEFFPIPSAVPKRILRVRPSVQSIHMNDVLKHEPVTNPTTCPPLILHSDIVKPAGRRKCEVLLKLRHRQLSQGNVKQTFSHTHRRPKTALLGIGTGSTQTNLLQPSPCKGITRIIHSSKSSSLRFDFPDSELKVEGRPPSQLRSRITTTPVPRPVRSKTFSDYYIGVLSLV